MQVFRFERATEKSLRAESFTVIDACVRNTLTEFFFLPFWFAISIGGIRIIDILRLPETISTHNSSKFEQFY